MKNVPLPRGGLYLKNAATVPLLILAALFAFIPGPVRADGAVSEQGSAAETAGKTPIDLSEHSARPLMPPSGNLLIDGAAKLLLVLAAVFALFWFLRRIQTPWRGGPAPGGPFEVASLVPLSAKSRLALVRFGNRFLLLSVASDRTEKLAETDDPEEVAQILGSLKRKGTEE